MTKNKKKFNWSMVLVLALIILLAYGIVSFLNQTPELTITEFKDMVAYKTYKDEPCEITDVKFVGTTIYVRVDGSKITDKQFRENEIGDFYFVVSSNARVTEIIEFINNYNNGELVYNETPIVKTNTINQLDGVVSEGFFSKIVPYLSLIVVIVVAVLIFKSISGANKGSMNFGKSKAKIAEPSKVKFNDVAGAKEEKFELQEIVEFLKNPKKFKDLGARIPKGVILVGPPGTGQTMLAKAVAGESNVPFFRISGSDFVEMFVGVGASRVRDLFEQAKKNAPAIIFIDEIDAVGRQRGAGLGGGNDEREQTLNQLLVEMDGFEATQGIIVMAATNRPDVLDPALLRPGRFDRQIYVNMPDVGEREQILLVHARNKKFTDDVNFKNLARLTAGFSGADLENLLNEAAILAARDNRPRITTMDLNAASTKVMMGPQKKSKVQTERDRKITAYHEAGHAILHKVLPLCDEVQEVSIIPRGMAGGYTMSRPENDEAYATVKKLNSIIASMMGGRIAEEIIFDDVSTGASNDIERATKLARKMVTEFGMSEKLGFINLGSSSEVFIGRDYQTTVQYSEATAKIIDEEVELILKKNYEEAKKILLDNIDKLHALANLLLIRETVFQEEVDMIMEGVDNETIIAKMTEKENKEREVLEKEKKEQELLEEQRVRELRERAFKALQQEGLIDSKLTFEEAMNIAQIDIGQKENAENTEDTVKEEVCDNENKQDIKENKKEKILDDKSDKE